MTQPYLQTVLRCTELSHVTLKVLVCVLFIFFNRAQRVLRSESILVTRLDFRVIAILPLIVSVVMHTSLMCPGFVIPTRGGRITVFCALIQMLLLHALAILLVVVTLNHYITAASFLSVILASHLCLVVRPVNMNIVQTRTISYGCVARFVAYMLPVVCWILLPILRIHELEAIVLLYTPEALCFVYEHLVRFTTLLLQVAVVSACSVVGASGSDM
jgi:hypothetical protein